MDNSAEALAEVRAAIAELPAASQQVMLLRDVEGRPPAVVAQTLDISLAEEQHRAHQARGLVRARLEQHFDGRRSS